MDTWRSPKVYAAIRAYAEAAAELFRARRDPARGGMPRWNLTPDGGYALDRSPGFGTAEDFAELHAHPAFDTAREALRDDSVIGPQLGQLIGTRWVRGYLSEPFILDTFAQLSLGDDVLFHEGRFNRLYGSLEADLYAEQLTAIRVTPILGLKITTGNPVVLGPGLEIGAMTEDEIIAGHETGVLPTIELPYPGAIRHRYGLPKIVGEGQDGITLEQLAEVSQAQDDEAERVVETLRLCRAGSIAQAGWLDATTLHRWVRGGTYKPGGVRDVPPGVEFQLREADIEPLQSLWKLLEDPGVRQSLGFAIRRFGYSGERIRDEDRIIDMMIAAEAAFLSSDSDDPAERGELRYRLSMRAASFVDMGGADAMSIRRFMRSAYDVRSSVVHGGAFRAKDLRRLDGSAVDLFAFAEELSTVIRAALVQLAEHIASTGKFPDWEARLLAPHRAD